MKPKEIGDAVIVAINGTTLGVYSLLPNGKKIIDTSANLADIQEDGFDETCSVLGHHVITVLKATRETLISGKRNGK